MKTLDWIALREKAREHFAKRKRGGPEETLEAFLRPDPGTVRKHICFAALLPGCVVLFFLMLRVPFGMRYVHKNGLGAYLILCAGSCLAAGAGAFYYVFRLVREAKAFREEMTGYKKAGRLDLYREDFRAGTDWCDHQLRLGEKFFYVRGAKKVLCYEQIKEVRTHHCPDCGRSSGYGAEIIMQGQEKYVTGCREKTFLTRNQALAYYEPLFSALRARQPELVMPAVQRPAPASRGRGGPEMESLKQSALWSYLYKGKAPVIIMMMVPALIFTFLLAAGVDTMIGSSQDRSIRMLSLFLVLISLFFLFLIARETAALFRRRNRFRDRMEQYLKEGIMRDILDDFERSPEIGDGTLRLGEKYVFIRGGEFVPSWPEVQGLRQVRESGKRYVRYALYVIVDGDPVFIRSVPAPEDLAYMIRAFQEKLPGLEPEIKN